MSNKNPARRIGLFFIAAALFSILGLVLYGPVLNNPEYLASGPTSENRIVLGAIFEMFTAVAVASTAIAFYPILKKRDETIAFGYIGGRMLEAFLIILGLVSILTLLSFRREIAAGIALDNSSILAADTLLRSTHSWAFILGPNFMLGINTLLYSYLLYQTELVPRKLAALGFVGAVAIFIAAWLELFGVINQVSTWGAVMALPVAVYEMTLAVYLITKGFNFSTVEYRSIETESSKVKVEPVK
jgi:hypothetical protein